MKVERVTDNVRHDLLTVQQFFILKKLVVASLDEMEKEEITK